MGFYVFGRGLPEADWCEPDEDEEPLICSESCDRFVPGGPECVCYRGEGEIWLPGS